MSVSDCCATPARAWTVAAVALALGTLAVTGQAPPPANPEEEAVERHLLTAAQAFRDKDVPAIRKAFAANFAGPLRVPKLAQTVLDQVMAAAQTVTADLTINEMHVEAARSLVIADLNLAFDFGGDAKRIASPYLFWLDKGAAGWSITGAEPMATDWALAEGSTEVHWPEDGVRFAMPKGWGAFPMTGPELRRGVTFVSPDLSTSIGVAVVVLPVPVQLKTLAAQSQGIATMYPGSRFIDATDTTLAGQPAIVSRLDLSLGPAPSRAESIMAIRESRLLILNRDIMPATIAPRFDEEFAAVRNSLTLEAVAAGAPGTPPAAPAKGFTNQRFGVGFPTPEGWTLQALDDETARKQGWAFGAHLRPAEGESYILIGGKELPGPVGLKVLQDEEMKTVATIAGAVTPQDVQDLKVSGLPARSWRYTLNLGQERQRREVFTMRGNLLVFVIADAIPPTAYDSLSKVVDGLLETMSLANP